MYYHLINDIMSAIISFILNLAGYLPDLQALPQPCSIKNKTDGDNIEIDNNNNSNVSNNDNNKNNINNKVI